MANRLAFLMIALLGVSFAQTLDNRSLAGKYLFRHLQLTAAGPGSIQSSRSLTGSATFDGAGAFTFTGQQIAGSAGPVTLAGTGSYAVQPGGLMTISNPQQTTLTMNARFGQAVFVMDSRDVVDLHFERRAPLVGFQH